jgi:hypothetical protein
MEIKKNIGRGITIVRFEKESPIQKIMNIGRDIKTRKMLEEKGAGTPNYTKSQRKKIRKDMERYFNSIENKYGKQ